VVTVDGLARGSFPQQAAEDRISAMSAAMLSLGERICGELGSGEMRYVLIAGAKTLQLLIVLSEDYVLELELRPNVSVDAALNAVKESTGPLLKVLRIETLTP
jgi:predicted regulator of Ras-like GTPase activity (Roadblock/LC7/MglB family)